MGISHKRPPSPLATAFIQSAASLGFREGDYNCQCEHQSTTNQTKAEKGVVGLHQQTVRQRTRCDTARAYIAPVIYKRSNLFVLTGVKCRSVMTETNDGTVSASGVLLVVDSAITTTKEMTISIRCHKEVILSAGALASPQILSQSGIGPNGSIVKSPQVGQNLQDHVVAFLHYTPKGGQDTDIGTINEHKAVGGWNDLWNKLQLFLFHRGMLTSSAYDASLFYASDPSLPYYDLQMSALCTPTNKSVFENNLGLDLDAFEFAEEDTAPDAEGMVICHTLLHPKSKGHVELNSAGDNQELTKMPTIGAMPQTKIFLE